MGRIVISLGWWSMDSMRRFILPENFNLSPLTRVAGQAAAISRSLGVGSCLNLARVSMVPVPGRDKGRLRRWEVKLESASSSSSRGRALRPGLQSSYLGPATQLTVCTPGQGHLTARRGLRGAGCSATGPYTPVINCLIVLSTLFIRDRLELLM